MSWLFTHKAYGQFGTEITVYKVRTMSESIHPSRDINISLSGELDPTDEKRLLFGARVIRKLGIDEIPQLLNLIIKRDMQLIGIRPFLKEEMDSLPHELKVLILNHKPGIIPVESYYSYKSGDLAGRISAIEAFLQENPTGMRRVYIGMIAFIVRLTENNKR